MVRALLRGFVDPELVGSLDLSTLQRQSTKFHEAAGIRRDGDIVYRVETTDGEALYLYVLLEFQSYAPWWMALRMSTYTALMYQHLIKEGLVALKDKLPCVLPIVLYNGKEPWEAPASTEALIAEPSAKLKRYQLQQSFLLLDPVSLRSRDER